MVELESDSFVGLDFSRAVRKKKTDKTKPR